VFFGAHAIGTALLDNILQWAVLLTTLITFWRVDHVAAGLLVPRR
jgi:tryptophan-rich sensory protein